MGMSSDVGLSIKEPHADTFNIHHQYGMDEKRAGAYNPCHDHTERLTSGGLGPAAAFLRAIYNKPDTADVPCRSHHDDQYHSGCPILGHIARCCGAGN